MNTPTALDEHEIDPDRAYLLRTFYAPTLDGDVPIGTDIFPADQALLVLQQFSHVRIVQSAAGWEAIADDDRLVWRARLVSGSEALAEQRRLAEEACVEVLGQEAQS